MRFETLRYAQYHAKMSIEKGNIYFTDTQTGKIKHHININEGTIYTHSRTIPAPMVSGIYFFYLEHNEKDPLEAFIYSFLKSGRFANKDYYNNLFDNFAFCESVLKIYGDKIKFYLIDELKRRCVRISDRFKEIILKDKNYMEWCFTNEYNPFCNYDLYVNEKIIRNLCGDNEQLYEGLKNQRIFTLSIDNPNSWKGLQFTIKVIQDSPNVIYAHTNSRLIVSYHNICDNVSQYLQMCADMGREPTTRDFLNEQARTRCFYYNWKHEHKTELFLKRYSDILRFSYGNLEVVLPTNPTDLTKEGNNNHNCVGGYIDYVVRGDCIIVFVRHKDDLDKSYLTCEITNDGNIQQFYLSYNNSPKEEEDKEFRRLYQDYLYQHIDEIKRLCGKF